MVGKAPLTQPTYNSLLWHEPLNTNFEILTDALGVFTSVAVTVANVTLTATQAQRAGIIVTGTLTGNRTLFLPANTVGLWAVYNNTGGAFSLTVAVNNGAGAPAGTTVTPPTGYSYMVYSDGVNVGYANGNTVQKSGDTMTGVLTLPQNGLNVGSGQLQVASGNVRTTGQFIAESNVSAFVTPSDIRLKKDIEQIPDALNKVLGMRGVTYRRIDNDQRGAGVIAQEVQAQLPEVVHETEEGMLYVSYGNIVSVLIEAIRELSDRIEELEKRG